MIQYITPDPTKTGCIHQIKASISMLFPSGGSSSSSSSMIKVNKF